MSEQEMQEQMMQQLGGLPRPRVADIVHYRSFGTPGGEYTAECRAAIVTEIMPPDVMVVGVEHSDPYTVGLCVLNPTGQFFNRSVPMDQHDKAGGTWHWADPEGHCG